MVDWFTNPDTGVEAAPPRVSAWENLDPLPQRVDDRDNKRKRVLSATGSDSTPRQHDPIPDPARSELDDRRSLAVHNDSTLNANVGPPQPDNHPSIHSNLNSSVHTNQTVTQSDTNTAHNQGPTVNNTSTKSHVIFQDEQEQFVPMNPNAVPFYKRARGCNSTEIKALERAAAFDEMANNGKPLNDQYIMRFFTLELHQLTKDLNYDSMDNYPLLMTICITYYSYQLSNLILYMLLSFHITLHSMYDCAPDAPSNVSVVRSDNDNNNAMNTTEDSNLVVNLSKHTLSQAQYSLLKRGLKFCPNPGEPDLSTYQADLNKFHLRIKRYLHFYKPTRNTNNETTPLSPSNHSTTLFPVREEGPFQHQSFKNPSAWIPPPVAPLEFFITNNNLDLAKCKLPASGKHNIPTSETRAIKELSNNKDIVIKLADKGGAVVIWDRLDYVREGLRQLPDQSFYKETPTDLTQTHHEHIVVILDKMLSEHRSCHTYLSDSKVRTAQFYMLPKIHKDSKNPPGRPIVSGNGCPTERISQFIDFFLQPCVKNIRSYIKDTTDFLLMLQHLGNLPNDCLLVTLDVASLYTNIPNKEGIEAALYSLNNARCPTERPSNDFLIQLLEKVLKCNNFDFDGKHYLQIGGTAMGTKVAPAYANTFMGWFEGTHVYTNRIQPLLWKRFIDDIFVIWPHGYEKLQLFIHHLNTCMTSIKLEAETSRDEVHFLDVTIKLQPDGTISTTLYTKPTDSHNYVNYRSCHLKSCKNGIPYGQFLRLRRICSSDKDFIKESKWLAFHFHEANYPSKLIQDSFERAFVQDRQNLLLPKPVDTTGPSNNLYLITTFHPTFHEVNRIVNRNMDLLDRSSSTRPIIQAPLIRGFRRCRNLRDLLVWARLPPTIGAPDQPNPGFQDRQCNRAHCIYCLKLDRTGHISSQATNRRYRTRTNISCRSNNLIYGLKCSICDKIYVGQTKRRIMDRLMEHFRNIRQNCQTHIVGHHYNSHGHNGLRDIRVHILDFIPVHPESMTATQVRDSAERKWIFRLRSQVPIGLNLFD